MTTAKGGEAGADGAAEEDGAAAVVGAAAGVDADGGAAMCGSWPCMPICAKGAAIMNWNETK